MIQAEGDVDVEIANAAVTESVFTSTTIRCTCRKHRLERISACGHCQHGLCDNMTNERVTEEDDEQDGI